MRILVFLSLWLLLATPLRAQPDYELSYILIRTAGGEVLAAQEEDKLRVPASTMKVVTASAGLQTLGPEHRYRTGLWTEAGLRRGRLSGDLCFRGDADPELRLEDLEDLAAQAMALGLRRVEGDLIVDEGPYADPPYGTGWAWDDAGEAYSPEVTGLAVGGGVVRLFPGFQAPWLSVEPATEASVQLVPGREGVRVRGELPPELAPPHSALRSGELMRQALERRGIKVRGSVRAGSSRGREIAVHQSRTLAEILRQALLVSDNLAMELVYRSSGSVLPQALQGQRLRRADGSGLSRYNLISARQLAEVLLAEPRLLDLLPSGGQGTLSTRFTDGPAAGQVKAKTGTLSNVSALTGYLFPGTAQECVFAVMVNGHVDSTAERKAIEDRLVQGWAEKFGSDGPSR